MIVITTPTGLIGGQLLGDSCPRTAREEVLKPAVLA